MALLESPTGSTAEPTAAHPVAGPPPRLATGVELLGAMAGSGYREAPALVRRADGQTVQVTPTLYALLESIDGERDAARLAEVLGDRIGMAVDPEQVTFLVEEKLRPLGVILGDDDREPVAAKANPLLALRCRYVVTGTERTDRITGPFTALFRPVVLWPVLVAFFGISGWLLADHGLAQGARHVLYEPQLLLLVLVLTLVSAGFHELGHAAACRYGGARPGAMGVGLYLVFPAFYTDVSDSYRLDRRGRLRTDLGGLYFNAVFAVGAFAAWWATGSEALLVIIPLQQLQMLKQLAPFVRLDGYHVLADLTGVPDLFSRVRPVLLDLLPWNWGRSRAGDLKPWVRAVVTAWVLFVVPILLFTMLTMLVTFPRLVATVWDSAGRQWDDLAGRWGDGDVIRLILSSISMLTLFLPLLSVSYFMTRLVRRTGRRVWRGTEGHPPLRFAAVAGGTGLVVLAAAALWPVPERYEPIRHDDRGTLADLTGAAPSSPPAAARPSATPSDGGATAAAAPAPVDPPLVVIEIDPEALEVPLPELPYFEFGLPEVPREADNQSLALNRTDGTVVNVGSSELVWVLDGVVDQVNEAWALANCRGCASQAVAFQVILVIGHAEVVSPQNRAVAVNGGCASCVANAIAQQLVLSLEAMPSDAELEALEAIWARVEQTIAALGTVPVDETMAELESLGEEIAEALAPSLAVTPGGSTTTTTATTAPAGEPTTTTAPGDRPEQDPAAPTSTTAPTPSTTATTAPPADEPASP